MEKCQFPVSCIICSFHCRSILYANTRRTWPKCSIYISLSVAHWGRTLYSLCNLLQYVLKEGFWAGSSIWSQELATYDSRYIIINMARCVIPSSTTYFSSLSTYLIVIPALLNSRPLSEDPFNGQVTLHPRIHGTQYLVHLSAIFSDQLLCQPLLLISTYLQTMIDSSSQYKLCKACHLVTRMKYFPERAFVMPV